MWLIQNRTSAIFRRVTAVRYKATYLCRTIFSAHWWTSIVIHFLEHSCRIDEAWDSKFYCTCGYSTSNMVAKQLKTSWNFGLQAGHKNRSQCGGVQANEKLDTVRRKTIHDHRIYNSTNMVTYVKIKNKEHYIPPKTRNDRLRFKISPFRSFADTSLSPKDSILSYRYMLLW